jgi:glucosamine--fructose-6-phosphate aminotransferase (isomerizing)
MCGIIACRTNQPAIEYMSIALRRLEYRGYDSVGIAMQTASGEVARLRTVGRIGALDRLVSEWPGAPFNGVGIGHTRWATHGSVTETNAHPHADCTGRIFVVHNGIVENALDLRDELTRSGHHFATSVDSEVFSHLIEHERHRAEDLFEAVRSALTRVRGSWALAVLEQGTGRIVVAAHGSPLLVARSHHGDFAASDIAAIADWTEEFRVLDDGDVVELTDGRRWVRGGTAATPVIGRCNWRARDAELNGYSDFMAKEIDEQPEAAARLIDELSGSVTSGALWTDRALGPFDRLRVLGCGTSLNAGHVIGNLVRRLGGVPVTFTIASEAAEETRDTSQLCLAISQSGETADVLHALGTDAIAAEPLLALTNNPHSSLARRADAILSCDAGPEIGVAATKTFVCQVIAGAALMISSLVATHRIDQGIAARVTDDLRRLPEQLAAAIGTAKSEILPLTEELKDCGGFIFVARGSGLPYAAEGALKLKELTYRWAEHYPAGELKHGPLALITEGTPVVVIDNGSPKIAINIAEIKARGGRLITIGAAGSSVDVLGDPHAPWGPLESVVPMQILARTIALALGHDVDKPRNLAKSVTVE